MRRQSLPNPLELRPAPYIGLSYLSGALAGGAVGAVYSLIETVGDQDAFEGTGVTLMSATVDTFLLIAVICLVVELVVATALLLGYRYFRWRFLNRWIAALIGLGIGAAPALVLLSRPLGDGTSVLLGYFYDGRLTASGWWRLLKGTAFSGAVGFASAAALAFVAVRKPQTGLGRDDAREEPI